MRDCQYCGQKTPGTPQVSNKDCDLHIEQKCQITVTDVFCDKCQKLIMREQLHSIAKDYGFFGIGL